ncbi:TPA: class I SAM-dependent methyltransferase family protein, partial [Candidatus Bathyarchaeota archaeon]|nr:class I SAM-dependent methyltransferase family protein [Candidatus Bathyarchaeota archaeon]
FLKPIDLAAEHLPPHLLASFPRSIEFIGQVAIIEFPPELEPYKEILGSSILKAHKNVKTVLAKAGAVKGAYRIRKFEIIAGSENTETVHKEFGCIFRLDPRRVYFSPRLSYEHFRVTSKVNEGENVIDMFAGVGPFSIMIAKKVKRVKVYAIDINPEAIRYLTMNIVLNGVEGKVISMLGDAREIISKRLRGIADRVIMNLPEKASVYLPVACNALKDKGGIIHCYQFARGENAILKAEKIAERIIKNSTYRKHCRILSSRIVREVAPFTWQVAVDLEVK